MTTQTRSPVPGGQSGGTTTYTWDKRGRMVGASIPSPTGGMLNVVYAYDEDGIRISQKVGSAAARTYLIDRHSPTGYAQTIDEYVGGVIDVSYAWGHGQVAQKRSSGVALPLPDAGGHVRGLTDVDGSLTDTWSYGAYGNVITRTGSTPNAYQYRGEYIDPITGLSFNRARWLRLGDEQFLSTDTFEADGNDPLFFHKRVYANGNPVWYADPTGMFSMTDLGVANSIRNILASTYLFVLKGVNHSASSVAQGLTVNQAIAGFALDELLAPIDAAVEQFQAAYELLQRGLVWLSTAAGVTVAEDPSATDLQQAGGGAGALLGPYLRIRRPAAIYQAHHLNQRAVWGNYIENNSASISLGHRQHQAVHAHMRRLYARHRLARTRPTAAECNSEMARALRNAGKSASVVRHASSLMRAEQFRIGFGPTSLIPGIPSR